MLMILARLVRSESFWAVAKVRSPHTGPGISYIIFWVTVTEVCSRLHLDEHAPRRAKGLDESFEQVFVSCRVLRTRVDHCGIAEFFVRLAVWRLLARLHPARPRTVARRRSSRLGSLAPSPSSSPAGCVPRTQG